jgi:hypothetical protein
MKTLAVIASICFGAAACGGKHEPAPVDAAPVMGAVSLDLARPHGALDPMNFTTVEVVLHEPAQASGTPAQDVQLTAPVVNNAFSLGTVPRMTGLTIEATLRNDGGAAVGYGRTSIGTDLGDAGAMITVPVERPIAYIAGLVSQPSNKNDPTSSPHWTSSPATFSDLTTGTPLDGTTKLGGTGVLMVSAGAKLFQIDQPPSDPAGTLTGMATITPVSTADHSLGTALTGQIAGAVMDGVGSDDGTTLIIGTSTGLMKVDTNTGTVSMLTTGAFARVGLVVTDSGPVAIAIKNRISTTATTCATTAELWWAPLDGTPAKMVMTGGFADIAADRGHAYYVDACASQLGELTASAATMLPPSLANLAGVPGKPTALAVSNGQAYIGLESQPSTTSLIVTAVPVDGKQGDPTVRVLWTEAASQTLDDTMHPDVQRALTAKSVVINQLEIGAGGDYVALTTSAQFHADELQPFPQMDIQTEELRVFDASNGASVQRYRSWCSGVISGDFSQDIPMWDCTSVTGQTAASNNADDHHISSMTFLYGKK